MRTGAFWHNHATSPVRFTDALENLARTGVRVFVELGEGMLCGLGRQKLAVSVADGPAWAVCLEKGGACVFDAWLGRNAAPGTRAVPRGRS
jgi:acyl transferase domain-containing protein